MRILYGVQGTGHGHISRAKVIIPLLREIADVDVLISGYNFNLELDGKIAFKKRGISLSYDSKGAIDILETARAIKPVRFVKDLQEIPVQEYDFVISDFEPVTAWAAQKADVQCLGLSHQAAFLSEKTPRPQKKSKVAEGIIKHFAPCDGAIGTHYKRYDDFIEPPILRPLIKELNPTVGGHITVYLPAFDHETLVTIFKQIPEIRWEIFSSTCDVAYEKYNTKVNPVGNDSFLKSFESSLGLLCSAGFEGPSEAMYLGKKLLVIPIRNQYEQICNAAALEELGARAIYSIKPDFTDQLRDWIRNGKVIQLNEICDEQKLVQKIAEFGMREAVSV
ncbi:MAG: glycosyltransferase family protein [Balneola sp.]